MRGRRLNAREEVVYHLARAGYGQQDISDLVRIAAAIRSLWTARCNKVMKPQSVLDNTATIARRQAEVESIVAGRNVGQDVEHLAAFQVDPRGAVVILHSDDGTEDSASWRIRL